MTFSDFVHLRLERGARLVAAGLWLFACACSAGSDTEPLPDGGDSDSGRDGGDGATEGGNGGGDAGVCRALDCGEGTSCDPDRGECVADCATLSCGAGQSCEIVGERAECVADCSDVECDDGEECDDSGATARCVAGCGGECGEGQRCTGSGDDAMCEDLSCADLDCQLPSLCMAAGDGQGGNVCVDISCDSDLDCEQGEYCFDDPDDDPDVGGYCQGSACTPGEQRCTSDDVTVEECLPNGSAWFARESCLTASCTEAAGDAFCPCDDDWSCPSFTSCEVDRCEGTGVAPTCFVPVAAMEDVLPGQEFQWGSNAEPANDDDNDDVGEDHPFPQSVQVVNVPLVVNLTDDNGDGEVNELDYPEIVFLSYCSNLDYNDNGVLRAIHGGGFDADGNPIAGKDYFATTGADCNPVSGCAPASPDSWLVWNEGEDGATDSLNEAYGTSGCQNDNDAFDSTSTLALGNLDGDAAGYPEIVALGEDEKIYIFDARGHFLARSAQSVSSNNSGSTAIANLDGAGLPEIVAGRYVWTLKIENGQLAFDKAFAGTGGEHGENGTANIGPVGCVADLDQNGRQEIIVGASAYEFPDPATCSDPTCSMDPLWTAAVPSDNGGYCAVADVWGANAAAPPHPVDNPLDGTPEVIFVRSGNLYVVDASGSIIDTFSIAGVGGGPPNIDDFDGDSMPEVGTAGSVGYTVIDFQAADPLDGQAPGCPAWPNLLNVSNPLTGVFADDRGPYPSADPAEVGNDPRVVPVEASGSPIMCNEDADCNEGIDPFAFACNESTGSCVCLHNGWTRRTQDGSSEVTGSSVFDFNGDGAAEVVYNDECFFRVYDGLDGRLYSRIPSESRTRTEYPVVADLDNDGNAEIVFGVSNESNFCDNNWDDGYDDYFVDADMNPVANNPYNGTYNAGLEVWGEPTDLWVSARRIWNQHSYHITNVTEGGGIPVQETPSWSPALRSERGFNSYRSNPPSRAGIAPDLQVIEVSVASSGGGCEELGSEIDITARIRNDGDLRVGADIQVAFLGTWGGTDAPLTDASDDPLVTTLGSPLRPGAEVLVRVTYDSAGKTPAGLPDSVTAIVDPDDLERECDSGDDMDNQGSADVVTPDPAPDLRVTLDDVTGPCPDKDVEFTVYNDGGEAAEDIVVRFYAGNPAAGGTVVGSATVTGPLEPGESVTDTATIEVDRDISLHAEVDPDDTIMECSEGNNDAVYEDPIICLVVPI